MIDLIARGKDGRIQSLKNHTIMTTNIASSKVFNPIVKKCVELASMLHDTGKASDKFQKKIRGVDIRTRHAFLGALTLTNNESNKYINAIQFMIEGHHSGLKNPEDYNQNILVAKNEFNNDKKRLNGFTQQFFDHTNLLESVSQAVKEIYKFSTAENALDFDVITRLGISALKDGDTTDAAAFESGEEIEPELFDVSAYINLLSKYYQSLTGKESAINTLRNTAKDEILSMLNTEMGFYSLNLPTGLGKTLLSIYWALYHARFNQMRRIIYVLPFNTISDQVGDVLIKIFGKENVLVDHSGATKEGEDAPFFVEKWNSPFIVTSSVQFFETLFSHKSKRIAKYHNIQRSVVIFDEFQTFPKELMEPTNVMLQTVQKYLECSFLYSTATMPWIESTYKIVGLPKVVPLIKNSNEYYEKSVRVNWEKIDERLSLVEVAQKMIEEPKSVLCIVNTKTNAHSVYKELLRLKRSKNVHLFHLSGNMLYSDRRRVLFKIKKLLSKNVIVKLISTQLVEAGVDIDFPVVYRTEAPFESIIQSAGRCNREGKLPELGKMILIRLNEKDYVDAEYEKHKKYTNSYITKNDTINVSIFSSVEGYKKYSKYILNTTTQNNDITALREKLKFRSVGESYRLIPDNAAKVYIYSGKKRKEVFDTIIEKVKNENKMNRKEWRIIHRNSISLFRKVIDKYIENGMIEALVVGEYPSRDGETVQQEIIYKWVGNYNSKMGIAILK